MPSPMEKVLGRPIRAVGHIPGTDRGEESQVRYVSYDGAQTPKKVFRQIIQSVDPPLPTRGGVMLEPCLLHAPDGTYLCCLYYHGDTLGWQRQIEQGAKKLGLLTARIEQGTLVLSDGRRLSLSECHAEFK